MELNEEAVKKSLNWLDSLVGNSNDSEIALFTYQLLGILYDTCEELTEDNKAKDETITNLIETIKSIQADTVRKMQEQLKMEIGRFGREGCSVSKEVIFWFIDQIAKEMLEGNDDND